MKKDFSAELTSTNQLAHWPAITNDAHVTKGQSPEAPALTRLQVAQSLLLAGLPPESPTCRTVSEGPTELFLITHFCTPDPAAGIISYLGLQSNLK